MGKRVHISSGIMEIVAGSEHSGFDGDGRSASFARFNDIRGLCAYEGDVYLCDCGNHRIRKYCVKENVVTTIAGDGAFGLLVMVVSPSLLPSRNLMTVVCTTR